MVVMSGQRRASGDAGPSTAGTAPATGGRLNQALADAVVRVHRRVLGRGPRKAQAFHHHDVVVVTMRDTLTSPERALVAGGREAAVLAVREDLHQAMEPELVAAVEAITGCAVQAFMGAVHLDPDLAVALFVLDQPLAVEAVAPAPDASAG
jgi:uncharacterized protein YbcI